MYILFYLSTLAGVNCFCGTNVGWTHQMNVEDSFGKWYGVGYAQHNQDMTDKPVEVGCVTLFISDASGEHRGDWLDWPVKQGVEDTNGWLYDNNPGRRRGDDYYDHGTWPPRFRAKRDLYHERRLKVLWDKDGQTMPQTYVYSLDSPGLWTAEQWRPGELELRSRGVDLWYPDNPPRHPEVIRVLKLSPDELIMNHCTDLGSGGSFSLVLRRYPTSISSQESYDSQKLMMSYGLPPPYRYKAVCAACSPLTSIFILFTSVLLLNLL